MNNLLFKLVFYLLIVSWISGMWRVFEKAGEPGWGSIIPLYWLYVLIKIEEQPGWWIVGLIVPGLNIFLFVGLFHGVAKRFGKSLGFGLGLMFLPFLFFPMLGFGDAHYTSWKPSPQ